MLISALATNTNTADRTMGNHSEASDIAFSSWGGAAGTMSLSVFFRLGLVRLGQLLLDLRGHRIVVRQLHREAALAAGERAQFGLVIDDFGERRLRLDHQHPAAQ